MSAPPSLALSPKAPRRSRTIPTFSLYGEARPGALLRGPEHDVLHVESASVRTQRFRGQIEPHSHPHLGQVVWMARGDALVHLDEWTRTVTGPAAVIVPPGVVHAFAAQHSQDGDGLVMTLRPAAWRELAPPNAGARLGALFEAPRLLTWSPDAPEVKRLDGLCMQLLAEFSTPDHSESPLPLWLAQSVLWRLAKAVPHALGPARQATAAAAHPVRFQRFLDLVEAHFPEHWPVARYAHVLGLSPQRLNRLTRAEADKAAQDIIHQRLVREACRRLVYTPVSVVQLANELGFDDPSYFCRFFRRHVGISPHQWQLQQQQAAAAA